MRTIPTAMRAALLASQTDKRVLEFGTLVYGATTYYFVNNTKSIDIGANTYLPFPFYVTFPPDKDGEIGEARLVVDTVDRSIQAIIRSITSRATLNIRLALADDPASSYVDMGTFEWKDITYDNLTASGTLTYGEKLDNKIPGLMFTPSNVPGQF